jgi:hypothetical protein
MHPNPQERATMGDLLHHDFVINSSGAPLPPPSFHVPTAWPSHVEVPHGRTVHTVTCLLVDMNMRPKVPKGRDPSYTVVEKVQSKHPSFIKTLYFAVADQQERKERARTLRLGMVSAGAADVTSLRAFCRRDSRGRQGPTN